LYGANVDYLIGGYTPSPQNPANYTYANSGPGPSGSGTNYYIQQANNNGTYSYSFQCSIAMADGCVNFYGPPLVDSSTGLTTTNTAGCTDPAAINYNATCLDDGSCIPIVFGCTDPNAINYFPGANNDDGSCIYVGCTNPAADNYDPLASIDDGSCCSSDPSTGLPSC